MSGTPVAVLQGKAHQEMLILLQLLLHRYMLDRQPMKIQLKKLLHQLYFFHFGRKIDLSQVLHQDQQQRLVEPVNPELLAKQSLSHNAKYCQPRYKISAKAVQPDLWISYQKPI